MSFMRSLTARTRDREDGFTLIELMVVVLIIAILIAIAIPTFLGARQRAQDRAAQSDLRNALTAEKTFYTDYQVYAAAATDADGSGVADLVEIESSLDWGGALTVVLSADQLGVCLEQTSKSGTTFALMDLSSGSTAGTYFAKAACPAVPNSGGAVPAGFATGGW
jgi:type IV pilus assembly protein PilA